MNMRNFQRRQWRGLLVLLSALVFMSITFCTKSNTSVDEGRQQQAMHLADSMFSIQKMQLYYDSLLSFLVASISDSSSAQSVVNTIYFDSLHGLIESYNQGKPTGKFYQQLGYLQYVRGWNDCEPAFADIVNIAINNPGGPIDKPAYANIYVGCTDTVFKVNIISRAPQGSVIARERLGYSASQEKYLQLIQ